MNADEILCKYKRNSQRVASKYNNIIILMERTIIDIKPTLPILRKFHVRNFGMQPVKAYV